MRIPKHTWKKSSYSGNTDNCVEVKLSGTVGVRDTKNPNGGQLDVAPAAWRAAIDRLRQA
jgi:hypothetical protein